MKDMRGFAFNVGCKVARAVTYGNSPRIDICTVTAIKEGKLYLDDSAHLIRFPGRLVIIEQDPLYRILKNYDNSKGEE